MKMTLRELGPCLVCGDNAIGINFGVPTCVACKAFFRRNAVKLGKVDFVCLLDGDCPVTNGYRRKCNCCRLAKCFRVGMQKSMIWSDTEKLARRDNIEQNREKQTMSIMRQKSTITRPANISYLPPCRSYILTISDKTLLTNVFSAYERIYPGTSTYQYPSFPAVEHTAVHTFFNEYEERYKQLIEYFKLIPEFMGLSVSDKVYLMQNHGGEIFGINEQIIARSVTHNLSASNKNMFGIRLSNDLMHSTERVLSYACDSVLLKLILIIRSLSSGINKYHDYVDRELTYDDTLLIFAGQNIYVEVLWRYLLSRFSSEKEAVKFFNKLILDLLFLQRVCISVECHMSSLESEVDKMEPLMQSLWSKADKIDNMNYNDIRIEAD